MNKAELEKIVIETRNDLKWMRENIGKQGNTLEKQWNKIEKIEKTLTNHCIEIKNLQKEIALSPSRAAKEIEMFLEGEFRERDIKIDDLETDVGILKDFKNKIIGIAIILGIIASSLWSGLTSLVFHK